MNLQQLQEAKKVAGLIVGYLNNDLSDIQRNELDEWLLESTDNMELFEKLTDENNMQESMEWFRNLDEEIALKKVQAKIESGKKLGIKSFYWIAAASLLIGFGYLFYSNNIEIKNEHSDENIVKEKPVVPGSKNAVLITATGEHIELGSSAGNYINLDSKNVVLDKSGKLLYDKQITSSINKVRTPAGCQYQIILSDGSKVWMNTSSELKFPTSFNENDRSVELAGEAYFEIKKNLNKPFYVKFKKGVILVTGTSFNVQNYSNDSIERITLLEGGIKLIAGNDSVAMKPDQESTIAPGGQISVREKTAATESIAWTKGLFSFNKASMKEVMSLVSRWYDIQVNYESIPSKQFTGNIPMKSTLETVLKMLELSGDVHFSLSGKTVTVRP